VLPRKLNAQAIRKQVITAVQKGQLGEKVLDGMIDFIKRHVNEFKSYMII